MADLTLAQRGAIAITSSDTSPKDVDLVTPIKPGSSQLVASIRDRRRNVSVQRGSTALTDADTSPKDVTITAVDVDASEVKATWRENRAGNARGATVKLLNSTTVRISWPGTLAPAETLDVDWEVAESKSYRGATIRLIDEDTLRVTWDGTLAAGETIDIAYEIWDADDIGDQLLEILFREQRMLAYLGENLVTDQLDYDDAGNVVQCRLRIFGSKADAENCTFDLPTGSGLEDGELARAQVVQEIDKSTNNRTALVRTLEQVVSTPGVS